MAETMTTKERQEQYIDAYTERTRLFNEMRNPNLSDDEREGLNAAYKLAALRFEKLRQEILK